MTVFSPRCEVKALRQQYRQRRATITVECWKADNSCRADPRSPRVTSWLGLPTAYSGGTPMGRWSQPCPLRRSSTRAWPLTKLAPLYATAFTSNQINRFDSAGNRLGTFGSGFNSNPESIVFDAAGNAYVGQADGLRPVLEFNSAGSLIATYPVQPEARIRLDRACRRPAHPLLHVRRALDPAV